MCDICNAYGVQTVNVDNQEICFRCLETIDEFTCSTCGEEDHIDLMCERYEGRCNSCCNCGCGHI